MIIIAKMLNIRHMGPLSNALNKAGLCQEIAFKRSNCLECSMKQTNHSSIFGITTTGIVQSLYSWMHAVNQVCQGLKGQISTCTNDCLLLFRQISRLVGTCIHGACYFGSQVLYMIHIRRHYWPFHVFNPFSFHQIVILVHKIMPKCQTSKWQ